MDNTILPSNEVKEFEERLYLNPNLQVEETTSFIDNLRNTQKANNQEIAQQTQALGTNVPSNLGGLTGAGSYFTSRYQTPQTNTVAQNLRAAAQADALNKALSNEQAMWKKRYNDAYRNYQKRGWNKSNNPQTTKDPSIEDILKETVTETDGTKKVTATTEELSRRMYTNKIEENLKKGMNIVDATNKAKADMGLD